MSELFQADIDNRGMILDPRTKLFAMLTIIFFVVGGSGIIPGYMINIYAALPLVLLFLSKRVKIAVSYGIIFLGACVISKWFTGLGQSAFSVIIIMCCVIIMRIIPGLMMGAYIFSTTTVSEFICAMEKMHITNKLSVPMSVMFRFFPTVMEEFESINQAMRMRDIRLGGKNIGKMFEYRIVPLMVCSVNIGNEIAEAALTRGLSADTRRTNICKIGFKVQDILLSVFLLIPYFYFLAEKTGFIS